MKRKAARSDDPVKQLQQLRHIPPPRLLVAKVMQELERPAKFQLWNWLSRPHAFELRLSPLAGLCAIFIAGVAGWAALHGLVSSAARKPASDAALTQQALPNAEVVLVRFVLQAQGAQRVALAGDFNGWDHQATPLQMQPQNDLFAVTLPLRKGQAYQYMFWVDGRWTPDPAAELRPDGFGQHNSVLKL